MARFTLTIDCDCESICNPYDEQAPSLRAMENHRRQSVARLLETVALVLRNRSDRDKAPIRDHNGNTVGSFEMSHD